METKTNNKWWPIALWLTGSFPLLLWLERMADPNGNANLISRNIETPSKLWFNGYLGTLTDLSLTGLFGILLVILVLVFFKQKGRLTPQANMLAIVYILASLIVAVLGYYNDRYQLTLLPFTLLLVAYFLHRLFDQKNQKRVVLVLAVLTLINTGFFFWFDLWARYASRLQDFKPKSTVEQTIDPVTKPSSGNQSVQAVADIYTFINSELPEGVFLVNNVPAFYVYTSRKGHYFWAGYDDIYLRNGAEALMEGRSDQELVAYLKNELSCRYILHAEKLKKFSPRFDTFLAQQCLLIARDKKGYLVYEIRESER